MVKSMDGTSKEEQNLKNYCRSGIGVVRGRQPLKNYRNGPDRSPRCFVA